MVATPVQHERHGLGLCSVPLAEGGGCCVTDGRSDGWSSFRHKVARAAAMGTCLMESVALC